MNVTPRFIGANLLYRERFLEEEGAYQRWNLFLVVDGSIEVNGKALTAGDLYFFAPQEHFSRRVLRPVTFWSIHLDWEGDPFELPRGKISVQDRARVLSTAAMMKTVASGVQKEELFRHFLLDLWVQITLERTYQKASHHPLVERALALLDAGGGEIGVRMLCTELGISHAYLITLFKRELGQTPLAYIVARRMERACALLLEQDIPIAQVAEQCGFANAYYFSNAFKKHTGHSPTLFREVYRA